MFHKKGRSLIDNSSLELKKLSWVKIKQIKSIFYLEQNFTKKRNSSLIDNSSLELKRLFWVKIKQIKSIFYLQQNFTKKMKSPENSRNFAKISPMIVYNRKYVCKKKTKILIQTKTKDDKSYSYNH